MSAQNAPLRISRTSVGSPTLVLVPTELELDRLRELGGFQPGSCIAKTCGFGPIAAAAATAHELSLFRPALVVLLGTAGTYDTDLIAIGAAAEFDEVAVDGIGAGEAARFVGPRALGFAQWRGSSDRAPIVDRIELDSSAAPPAGHRLLLSVCATSATHDMAVARCERFPGAAAEDMEGFGVALACAQAGVPLRIVRGISNVAGDRDHARWQILPALTAARKLALTILGEHALHSES